ncbi:hypothetical protein [Owenweeksia hongkongensis]|uniref:hypothetical protein n=1 Tax=Owenweeksia hongkongensis TaxID=253245 RepID=UPI003A90F6FF
MKKIILLIGVFLLPLYSLLGQYGDISQKQVTALRNTSMLFVQSGNSFLDSLVESSLKQSWNYIPFKVVSSEESKQHIGDPEYSFLTFVSVVNAYDEGDVKSTSLSLILTQEKDKKKGELQLVKNSVAFVPLDADRPFDKGGFGFTYKLPDLMKSLEQFLEIAEHEKGISLSKIKKKYINNRQELESHTLLFETQNINSDYIENQEAFFEVYPYELRFVEPKMVVEAIKDKETNYAYFYTTPDYGNGAFTVIVEAGTGRVLWFDHASFGGPRRSKLTPHYIKAINL